MEKELKLRPNPIKKLLIGDERLFFILATEWQFDALICALELYKRFLKRAGKEDEVKLVEKFLLEQFEPASIEDLKTLL